MIARSLRRAREAAGLTRAELGSLVGVAEKAVVAYEGESARVPAPDVLRRLVEVLSEAAPWFAEKAKEAERARGLRPPPWSRRRRSRPPGGACRKTLARRAPAIEAAARAAPARRE